MKCLIFFIRIQAIETLSALGLQKSFGTLTTEQQKILSCTFANFLPGIVIALTKVATADEKQSHKVTAVSISDFTSVETNIFGALDPLSNTSQTYHSQMQLPNFFLFSC